MTFRGFLCILHGPSFWVVLVVFCAEGLIIDSIGAYFSILSDVSACICRW